MNSSQATVYLPKNSIAQRNTRAGTSIFAVLLLAMVMNSSLFSVMGTKLGVFSLNVGHIVSAGPMLLMILFSIKRLKRLGVESLPNWPGYSLAFLVSTVVLLGFLGYTTSLAPRNLQHTVLIKALGTILTISALMLGAFAYKSREIQWGLQLFALVELTGTFLLYRSGADVNPNALSVRASVAGMCLFALLPSRALCFAFLGGSLLFSFVIGCRTSVVATVGAVVFFYVERTSRKNRVPTLLGMFVIVVGLLVFFPTIMSAVQKVLISNLGSDNPLAEFLLHDKSASKIRTDFLDRFEVWGHSWRYIQRRPVLGYGLGLESELMNARSHNAYLSLLFEGGILFLAAWMSFYIAVLANLFNQKWVMKAGESRLFYLAMMLLGYMLLAGIVESSGLASMSTPANTVFIFLAIWLLYRYSKPGQFVQ